ncbi:hypothetical protein HGI32_06640 [Clostridium acetobutylicum]|uniref:Predicted membrane protein n=2 Tax=Clostridiaceae TaxID=31979 RepID=Q97F26_CLOAB|nr:Predicted membrane protein [Clostridium acetobutylicum ATCC 824]AEI32610.1 hypothetical protein SMB_G2965 [Clostridium acetobutylicum DSM 1731]AWV78717.1 hypothetical protein DK921_01035 [Clostridium acetobutylicum]PSM06677.1 hypothetical protein C7T89_01035 [Clostridium sp. NJ4]MBC2393580.1 hypothetical protein [Clostridium acetobutylicum]
MKGENIMEMILNKLGYKENEEIKFLNKGPCGVWLIWIGIIIILGTMFGGENCVNPGIFSIGYALGMIIIFRTEFIKKYLSYGKNSSFQSKMANISIIVMFVTAGIIGGRYFGEQNFRMIWLAAFLATAIHFVPFSVVHGKLLLVLAFLVGVNAIYGMMHIEISFYYIGIIDGILKIAFGILMVKFRQP